MSRDDRKFGWLPGAATALSLIACYGTLAVIATLGALGVAIALDEALWAGAIMGFAGLAVGLLAVGARRRRRFAPLALGGLGALVLGYAMYGQYSRITEIAGFALLCLAALLEWRQGRAARPGA